MCTLSAVLPAWSSLGCSGNYPPLGQQVNECCWSQLWLIPESIPKGRHHALRGAPWCQGPASASFVSSSASYFCLLLLPCLPLSSSQGLSGGQGLGKAQDICSLRGVWARPVTLGAGVGGGWAGTRRSLSNGERV